MAEMPTSPNDAGRRSPFFREEFEAFERRYARDNADINEALREIRRDIQAASNKGTDWKAIISGVSLFATVVSIIGAVVAYGLNSRLDTLAKSGESVQTRLHGILYSRFDREAAKELREALESDIALLQTDADADRADLDRRLRETAASVNKQFESSRDRSEALFRSLETRMETMRDHIRQSEKEARAYSDGNKDELDTALQREMRLLDAIMAGEIQGIREALDKRRTWMDQHDRWSAETNSRQDEQLRQMEAYDARLSELEQELARRASAIDFIEAEQARRRPLVYDKE